MKNIKTELRRAFTIVELVIVIVVIAALAAVLIPTFANVMNAANESADTSLVKNLNTSLVAVEGQLEKNDDGIYNVTEAITLVRNDGYDVSKLTPSADNADIVYNASTNRFLYYTDNFADLSLGEEPDSDDVLVVIDNTLSRIATVSASESLISGNIVQYCVYSTESTVTVETDKTVTIWVYSENNATVTIDAANSTIWQDGDCYYVTVTCSKNSYHPLGIVNFVEMLKGRYVPESQGNVSYVYVSSTDYNDDTVTFEDFSADIKTIVLTDSDGVTAGGKSALNVNDSSAMTEYYDDFIVSETIITEATCTQEGEAIYTTILGTTGTRTIDKLDHSYGDETKKDYVIEGKVYTGGTIHICSVCGGFEPVQVGTEECNKNSGYDTSKKYGYTYSDSNGETINIDSKWVYDEDGTTLLTYYLTDYEYYYIYFDDSYNQIKEFTLEVPYGTTAIADGSYDKNGATYGVFWSDYIWVKISNITLPDTLTKIGDCAFYGQNELTSIEIPDTVTEIGDYAFSGCSRLTTVAIGKDSSLQTIGDYAFNDCNQLGYIVVPTSVTSIGENAFYTRSSLTAVYYRGTDDVWSKKFGSVKTSISDYATLYYYSEESTSGNYWRYVDNVATKWE